MWMGMGDQGRRDRTERMGGAWGTGGARGEDGGVEVGRTTHSMPRPSGLLKMDYFEFSIFIHSILKRIIIH